MNLKTVQLQTAAAMAYATQQYVELGGLELSSDEPTREQSLADIAQQAHEFLNDCGLSACITARVNRRGGAIEIRARRDVIPDAPSRFEKPETAQNDSQPDARPEQQEPAADAED